MVKLLSRIFFQRQGLLYCQGWPQTRDLPAWTSRVSGMTGTCYHTQLVFSYILSIYTPPSPILGYYSFCQLNKEYKISCLDLHLSSSYGECFSLCLVTTFIFSENHLFIFMHFVHIILLLFISGRKFFWC